MHLLLQMPAQDSHHVLALCTLQSTFTCICFSTTPNPSKRHRSCSLHLWMWDWKRLHNVPSQSPRWNQDPRLILCPTRQSPTARPWGACTRELMATEESSVERKHKGYISAWSKLTLTHSLGEMEFRGFGLLNPPFQVFTLASASRCCSHNPSACPHRSFPQLSLLKKVGQCNQPLEGHMIDGKTKHKSLGGNSEMQPKQMLPKWRIRKTLQE